MADFVGYCGDRVVFNTLRDASRYAGASPSLAYLALAGSGSPIQRTMLIMGGLLRGERPRLSSGGYAVFCYMLSRTPRTSDNFMGLDASSYCAGLITARWIYNNQTNLSDNDINETIDAYARAISESLGSHDALIKASLQHIKSKVAPALPDTVDELIINGTTPYLSGILEGVPSYGGRFITIVEGGGVPWGKLYGAANGLATKQNRDAVIGYLVENFAGDWHQGWEPADIIALCNFIGRNNQEFVRTLLMRATFITIAAICKGPNMTDSWVSTRWETLKSQYPILSQGGEAVTRVQVSSFNKIFIGNTPRLSDLYSGMAYIHRISESVGVEGLRWIIEQARGTNITGLTAIARAVTQFDVCTYTVLSQVIRPAIINSAVTAMLYTIGMPYGTLHGPYIPIARYAEMAAVGISLTLDKTTEALYNSCMKKLSTPQDRIIALVNQIKTCQTTDSTSAVSVERIIAAYQVNAAVSLQGSCSVLAYDGFSPATEQLQDGVPADRISLPGSHIATLTNLGNALKTYTLREMIDAHLNNRDKGLKLICQTFLSSIEQSVVNPDTFFGGDTHVINPIALTAPVTTAVTHLGAPQPNIPPIQLEQLAAIAPHAYTPFPTPQAP